MKFYREISTFDLKGWMKENKVTYRKLAEVTGINASYLYRLMDEMHTASPEMAEKLFKVLNNWDKTK